MKKLIFILMLSALFTLNKSMAISPIPITLSINIPTPQSLIFPDRPVLIGISISGLHNNNPDPLFQVDSLLGGFSFDFSYDPSFLAPRITSTAWGPLLGNPSQGQAVAETNLFAPGLISLDLVSLLSEDELRSLQDNRNNFLLASLFFDQVQPRYTGSTIFDTSNPTLSDASGEEIVPRISSILGLPSANTPPLEARIVPEINAASAPVGLAILVGGLLLLGERSRGRSQPTRSDSGL